MKRRIVSKLLAGILVVSICVTQVPYGLLDATNVVYAEETNLLTNGSFETNLGGEWRLTCKTDGKNAVERISAVRDLACL